MQSSPSEVSSESKIPTSTSTVTVKVIDTGTRLLLKSGLFWKADLSGFDAIHTPIFCFLVSHGDRHVIFDLGVRSDWENYAPKIVQLIKATTQITSCEKDVAAILDDEKFGNGVASTDVEAIIWSHSHFDHAGDPSRFSAQTRLVIGPGLKSSHWPGYPSQADSPILDSDFAGREIEEVDFQNPSLRIGGFDAMDYFGDGSFYLLDAPGHAPGHLCGLARTTAEPASFVFMGADSCHHAGILRPSSELPLPIVSKFSASDHGGCPGHVISQLQQWKSDVTTPFLHIARGPIFSDFDAAADTVTKIQELDSMDNIFVILAHDKSLTESLRLYPADINDWKAQELKSATRWKFCNDFRTVKP